MPWDDTAESNAFTSVTVGYAAFAFCTKPRTRTTLRRVALEMKNQVFILLTDTLARAENFYFYILLFQLGNGHRKRKKKKRKKTNVRIACMELFNTVSMNIGVLLSVRGVSIFLFSFLFNFF